MQTADAGYHHLCWPSTPRCLVGLFVETLSETCIQRTLHTLYHWQKWFFGWQRKVAYFAGTRWLYLLVLKLVLAWRRQKYLRFAPQRIVGTHVHANRNFCVWKALLSTHFQLLRVSPKYVILSSEQQPSYPEWIRTKNKIKSEKSTSEPSKQLVG